MSYDDVLRIVNKLNLVLKTNDADRFMVVKVNDICSRMEGFPQCYIQTFQ